MEQKIEQMNDEELYQYFHTGKVGSEKAFTELYNRYSPQVYAYCRRFLGSTDEAQDVFQETFIKFHQIIEQKQGLTNAVGLMLKIARNQCLNSKRKIIPTVPFEEYMTLGNENRNESDELLNMIKIGIDLLPDDLRELFVLREYDGMSYIEIAEITGQNMNTIKVKLFRAKKKLRKILEPYLADLSKYE
jgi:RNA polymerase sigma factor (sigma-70 family)